MTERYRVYVVRTVSSVVEVEVPSGSTQDDIVDAALMSNDLPASLCHQCSHGINFDGEWEVSRFNGNLQIERIGDGERS
jgi:hypothetical protein